MKTLYYPAFNELTIEDRPVPEITDYEVLVQVAACGICGSELESFAHQSAKRTPPIIMGHEFSGVITAVGKAVRGFAVNDKIVSNSIVFCGACAPCKAGATNLCTRRQVFSIHRNGAFGEFVNVPQSSLLHLPAGLSAEEACLAEPLANGVHMVNLTSHIRAKKVLVIGAGPIGLMALQAFRAMKGAQCLVSDIDESRLEVARQLGAEGLINPVKEDLLQRVADWTEGRGVDIVIDAVGRSLTATQGIKAVRTGGAVVMIGLQENNCVVNSYDIIMTEKQVIGSYAATQEDMAIALTLMAEGHVDVKSWVNYYPLTKGVEAFKDMLAAKDGHIKSVIIPD